MSTVIGQVEVGWYFVICIPLVISPLAIWDSGSDVWLAGIAEPQRPGNFEP